MEEQQQKEIWEGYVDWRGRPASKSRHGGMFAALFVLVAEVLETLAFSSNATNLVLYFAKFMHFSPSKSANSLTNFMGTAWFLAILGGFCSDAFFTTYHVFISSALIELLGLVIMTIQARSSSLKPPPCDPINTGLPCEQVSGGKAAMLFGGLYLIALGVGGIKGSLAAHGAEQFDQSTESGRKQRSTFFTYFIFCMSSGGMLAVTFVVWLEDNKGYVWGFGIATVVLGLAIFTFLFGTTAYRNKKPSGSPLTIIAKVLLAAMFFGRRKIKKPASNAVVNMSTSPMYLMQMSPQEEEEVETKNEHDPSTTNSLKFLNRAVNNKQRGLECSVEDVEDVKVVLKIFPIFASTIVVNCCLAQMSTFSVQQAATMDRKLGSLIVPPASLPIFPVVFMMILAPLYDHLIVPFARRVTKTEMGIPHLQRIGLGLVLSIVSMAVAALVEIKRKRVATHAGLLDSEKPLPMTFFWVALQCLFIGSSDLFTLVGSLEFFFTEAPARMRSLSTSLSWVALAMGFYLSSVLVSIVNAVTGSSGHKAWLSGNNLNDYHLERFYWLMCVLSALNLLQYLIWAKSYKYRSTPTTT
ncbi:hypothetical protein ACHQM5_016692 [Ranunculus cassubicifolius]